MVLDRNVGKASPMTALFNAQTISWPGAFTIFAVFASAITVYVTYEQQQAAAIAKHAAKEKHPARQRQERSAECPRIFFSESSATKLIIPAGSVTFVQGDLSPPQRNDPQQKKALPGRLEEEATIGAGAIVYATGTVSQEFARSAESEVHEHMSPVEFKDTYGQYQDSCGPK